MTTLSAHVTVDDSVVIQMPHVSTGDSHRFLSEHFSHEQLAREEIRRPNVDSEQAKRPESYGKTSVHEFDREVRVSVFKHDDGDIKTLDDPGHVHRNSDSKHPENPEYKYVGYMRRVERVKGRERVYFPFVVSRTRVAFTKIKEVKDLRADSDYDDFDYEAATGEEREEEDYLLFTHSNSGSDRWLFKYLRLDIVL